MEQHERVVFSHTMESLLERCASGLTDEKWAHLATLGISRGHSLPAYEAALWFQVIEYVARAVYPEREIGAAEYQIGRDFIERYAETLVGRALFALLRLLGTKRTVHRLTRSFRTGTNFTQVEIEDESDTGCIVAFNVVEPRGRMTHGVLSKGLEVAGIPDLKVALESLDGERARYRLSWSS